MQQLLQRSVRQRWRHLANDRLERVKRTIPLGKRFWAITAEMGMPSRSAVYAYMRKNPQARALMNEHAAVSDAGQDAVEQGGCYPGSAHVFRRCEPHVILHGLHQSHHSLIRFTGFFYEASGCSIIQHAD
jgi:hypothetical protein